MIEIVEGAIKKTPPTLTRFTRPTGRRRFTPTLSMKYILVFHLFEAVSLHSTVQIHSR